MAKPTLQERRLWWTYTYAFTSLNLAHAHAAMLLENCDTTDHPLYSTLVTSMLLYYGRPFMRVDGKAEPFPKDFLDPQSTEARIHDAMMTFRNRLIAHNDSCKIPEAGEVVHRVMYEKTDGWSGFYTRDPRVELDACAHFKTHIFNLRAAVWNLLQSFNHHFADELPTENGLYEINLSGVPDTTFVPLTNVAVVMNFKAPDENSLDASKDSPVTQLRY